MQKQFTPNRVEPGKIWISNTMEELVIYNDENKEILSESLHAEQWDPSSLIVSKVLATYYIVCQRGEQRSPLWGMKKNPGVSPIEKAS